MLSTSLLEVISRPTYDISASNCGASNVCARRAAHKTEGLTRARHLAEGRMLDTIIALQRAIMLQSPISGQTGDTKRYLVQLQMCNSKLQRYIGRYLHQPTSRRSNGLSSRASRIVVHKCRPLEYLAMKVLRPRSRTSSIFDTFPEDCARC